MSPLRFSPLLKNGVGTEETMYYWVITVTDDIPGSSNKMNRLLCKSLLT